MKINEDSLRVLIRESLKNEAKMRILGQVGVPDWFGRLRSFFRNKYGKGGSVNRAGPSILSPNDVDIREAYMDSVKNIHDEDKVNKDTQKILNKLSKELLYSSPNPVQVSKQFDNELINIKNEWRGLINLSPTASLPKMLPELNMILQPLNMHMTELDVESILNHYKENENYSTEDRAAGVPPKGLRDFLDSIRTQVESVFKERIQYVLEDIKKQHALGTLSSSQLSHFEDFINKDVR